MVERTQRGTRRAVTAVVLVVSALALLGNAIVSLLPHSDGTEPQRALTKADLINGYSHVRPGQTRALQLSRYGLEASSAGTQVLSFLGMMERFVPHDTARFDTLDPAIKNCVAVQDHCAAMVFRSANPAKVATGHGLFAALALDAEATPQTTQVVLLIRDGRVAFKMISGVPRASHIDRQARAIPVPFRMAY